MVLYYNRMLYSYRVLHCFLKMLDCIKTYSIKTPSEDAPCNAFYSGRGWR